MDDNRGADYSQLYGNSPRREEPFGAVQAVDDRREILIRRGRREAIALTVLMVPGTLAGLSSLAKLGNIPEMIGGIIGTFLPLFLSILILKRVNWARIVLGVIFAADAAFTGASGMFTVAEAFSSGNDTGTAVLAVCFIIFFIPAGLALVLLAGKAVKAYCGSSGEINVNKRTFEELSAGMKDYELTQALSGGRIKCIVTGVLLLFMMIAGIIRQNGSVGYFSGGLLLFTFIVDGAAIGLAIGCIKGNNAARVVMGGYMSVCLALSVFMIISSFMLRVSEGIVCAGKTLIYLASVLIIFKDKDVRLYCLSGGKKADGDV